MVADSRDVQASEQMKVDNDETREIDIIIGDEYLAKISHADTPAASVDHGWVRELIMMEIERFIVLFQICLNAHDRICFKP